MNRGDAALQWFPVGSHPSVCYCYCSNSKRLQPLARDLPFDLHSSRCAASSQHCTFTSRNRCYFLPGSKLRSETVRSLPLFPSILPRQLCLTSFPPPISAALHLRELRAFSPMPSSAPCAFQRRLFIVSYFFLSCSRSICTQHRASLRQSPSADLALRFIPFPTAHDEPHSNRNHVLA